MHGTLEAPTLNLQAIIYSVYSQSLAIKPGGARIGYGMSRDMRDLNKRAGPATQSTLGGQLATAASVGVHASSQKNPTLHNVSADVSNVNNSSDDLWSFTVGSYFLHLKFQVDIRNASFVMQFDIYTVTVFVYCLSHKLL